MEDLTRPICAHCTRAARTVDTPLVKVRVERCIVFRDGPTVVMLSRCHGAVDVFRDLGPAVTEPMLARLEVFRVEKR